MNKLIIAIIAGTRPEVIKLAPVHFALQGHPRLQPVFISTGQHREMLEQAFAVFGLKPDIDLGLMTPGQTLPDLTARILLAVAEVLRERKPAAVLVQGDTTTAFASALAAFYERVPIGHVEAGLRTYDYQAPWPEEMNRRLVDPISRWCFAPTAWSAANLRDERIAAESIYVTGNTVIDALFWVRAKQGEMPFSPTELARRCGIETSFAEKYLCGRGKRFILVTGHRRESFGAGFEDICHAIAELASRHPDLGIVYPVHLNPNVQRPVLRILGDKPGVALILPLNYENFIWLMDHCYFVLSDSGGVQEEAPSLGKAVLVMRDTTERPEGVEAGTCRLVGTKRDVILREAGILIADEAEYRRRSMLKNPYGDGLAATRIAQIIDEALPSH